MNFVPWDEKTTILDAKNRVRQFDQDRQFNDIASGRTIPQNWRHEAWGGKRIRACSHACRHERFQKTVWKFVQ